MGLTWRGSRRGSNNVVLEMHVEGLRDLISEAGQVEGPGLTTMGSRPRAQRTLGLTS